MCTPRNTPVPPLGSSATRPEPTDRGRATSIPGRCRWIDHRGLEWLFSRSNGALIVERPGARVRVAIRFPEQSDATRWGAFDEISVRVHLGDGQAFRPSGSGGVDPPMRSEAAHRSSQRSRVWRSGRVWFEGAEPAK